MPYLTADPLGLRPNIIPPSRGDLEEARIKRALDLAQLANLRNQTGLDLRRQALAQAGLSQAAAFHQDQVSAETRGQDIQIRGQDLQGKAAAASEVTTIRGQDLEANARKESVRGNLLATAFNTPTESLKGLSEVAKLAGFPEYAEGFATAHESEIDTKAQQIGEQLAQSKASGDATVYLTQLNDAKANPEVYKRILAFNPELGADAKSTGPDYVAPLSPGTKIGKGVGLYGKAVTLPITAPAYAGRALYRKRKVVVPFLEDFRKGLASAFQ